MKELQSVKRRLL